MRGRSTGEKRKGFRGGKAGQSFFRCLVTHLNDSGTTFNHFCNLKEALRVQTRLDCGQSLEDHGECHLQTVEEKG